MEDKKFRAVVIGETQYGKSFRKMIVVRGENAKRVYTELKSGNEVVDIESFEEVN